MRLIMTLIYCAPDTRAALTSGKEVTILAEVDPDWVSPPYEPGQMIYNRTDLKIVVSDVEWPVFIEDADLAEDFSYLHGARARVLSVETKPVTEEEVAQLDEGWREAALENPPLRLTVELDG